MEIEQYLDEHFAGNKADFARAFGRQPQNVSKIFKDPSRWRVITEGDEEYLVELKSKRRLLKYRVHCTDSYGGPDMKDLEAVTLPEILDQAREHVASIGGTDSYLQELNR